MTKRSISRTNEDWQVAFLSALGLHIIIAAMSVVLSMFFDVPRPLPPVYNVKLFDVSDMPASRPAPLGRPTAKADTAPKIGSESHKVQKALPPVPKIPVPKPPKPVVEKEARPKTPPPKPIEKRPEPRPETKPKETVSISADKKIRPEPRPEEKAEKPPKATPQAQKQKEEDVLAKKLQSIQEHVKEERLLNKSLNAIQEHVQEKENAALLAERIAALAEKLEKKGIEKEGSNAIPSGSIQAGGGGQINNELLRQYLGEMVSAVQSRWVLPDELINKKGLLCIITFGINSDGSITNIQFEKKSGQALFDQAALRAVKDAAPFQPIPRAIAPLLSDGIGLKFTQSGVTL
ncbi:MAG: TonB family protein [Dissulfurimicrobium sp.]|uniref:cell envelope integrity protein TolA n=1 Tax=Dissulfurimicrobium TaxID=1769732 RepID=UPI001EDBF5F9|nr:cell envelope integrity protein TolA [Dissulfurimicrobium hydrothermale]UKL14358.1 TonB family protein [Dissulfurimicrobium hydrothermale]